METQIQKASNMESSLVKFKGLLSQDSIKKKFNEALGKKAPMFMSNLVTIMSNNAELQKCEHMSVISSALMAASMDLALTPGLGFAGIVPYKDNKADTMKAQFQIMKKGYIQLAQRTGLFKNINVTEVYEGEIKKHNRFTGEYEFDAEGKKSDTIIGYVSYFRLINGFEKYLFMSIEQLDKHAKKYSKSLRYGKGKWADTEGGGYEQMCEKTVLKLNLSTYAPLSTDINMMNAIVYDQAEIRDMDAKDYDYLDNEESVKPTEKEVYEVGEGTTITVDKSHQERSQNLTSKATEKIDKANKSSEASQVDIEKTSLGVRVMETQEEKVSTIENNEEIKVYSKEELDKMNTTELLDIVDGNDEMNSAKDTLEPIRNTAHKLKKIIELYQEGKLEEEVEKFKEQKAKIQTKEESEAPEEKEEAEQGELQMEAMDNGEEEEEQEIPEGRDDDIQPNKEFEAEKKSVDQSPSEQLTSNKHGIEVPELPDTEEKKRNFQQVNTLYNEMGKIGIDNKVFEDIVKNKLTGLNKYSNKELFCFTATAHEINLLLDSV